MHVQQNVPQVGCLQELYRDARSTKNVPQVGCLKELYRDARSTKNVPEVGCLQQLYRDARSTKCPSRWLFTRIVPRCTFNKIHKKR
jgi:hypothetical protein